MTLGLARGSTALSAHVTAMTAIGTVWVAPGPAMGAGPHGRAT